MLFDGVFTGQATKVAFSALNCLCNLTVGRERTDFLDPMHHKAATGRDSLNLDGWMLSR